MGTFEGQCYIPFMNSSEGLHHKLMEYVGYGLICNVVFV